MKSVDLLDIDTAQSLQTFKRCIKEENKIEEHEEEQHSKKMSTKLGHFLSNVPLCACACACECVYTCACVCACVRAYACTWRRSACWCLACVCVFGRKRSSFAGKHCITICKFVLFI